MPRDAAVVAYADVREVMTSELRQRLRSALPMPENGQREFAEQDRHQHRDRHRPRRRVPRRRTRRRRAPRRAWSSRAAGSTRCKIEALMREHGAHVEDYKGKRLIVADEIVHRAVRGRLRWPFIEPGLVALGSTAAGSHRRIDLHQARQQSQAGIESVTGNDELMNLVRSLDTGNAWAVGRFDALTVAGRTSRTIRDSASRDYVVLGQRARQRRDPRRPARRDARRGSRQQPARRRPRVPGARRSCRPVRNPKSRRWCSRWSSAGRARPWRCRSTCRRRSSTSSAMP